MLDLNLTVGGYDEEEEDELLELCDVGQNEHSGSFGSSSVVNAEASSNTTGGGGGEDDSSSTRATTSYNFDILNNVEMGGGGTAGFVTKQLFPVTGGGDDGGYGVRGFGIGFSSTPPGYLMSSRNQYVGSSREGEYGGVAEQNQMIVAQQQKVKKNRRGPRSRSSQYRGVTFYRRTGRWESHIWDCGKQVYLGKET